MKSYEKTHTKAKDKLEEFLKSNLEEIVDNFEGEEEQKN